MQGYYELELKEAKVMSLLKKKNKLKQMLEDKRLLEIEIANLEKNINNE